VRKCVRTASAQPALRATSASRPTGYRHGMRPTRERAVGSAVALVLMTVMGLTGCSTGSPPGSAEPDGELAARSSVAALVQDITRVNGADIGTFARRAAEHTAGSSIVLIGYNVREAADLSAPLGELDFQVAVIQPEPYQTTDSADSESGPYCSSVGFNYYGKAVGAWDTVEGIESVECPEDATAISPPPDKTIYFVVASNAVDVTLRVLASLPEDAVPDADAIATMISAELAPPEGAFTAVAEPTVLVDGTRVGVAMGGADDCVLMQRVDGQVSQLSVPRVLLQHGELGCAPSTALASPESLRPPH
jgi:hypothetical protein